MSQTALVTDFKSAHLVINLSISHCRRMDHSRFQTATPHTTHKSHKTHKHHKTHNQHAVSYSTHLAHLSQVLT